MDRGPDVPLNVPERLGLDRDEISRTRRPRGYHCDADEPIRSTSGVAFGRWTLVEHTPSRTRRSDAAASEHPAAPANRRTRPRRVRRRPHRHDGLRRATRPLLHIRRRMDRPTPIGDVPGLEALASQPTDLPLSGGPKESPSGTEPALGACTSTPVHSHTEWPRRARENAPRARRTRTAAHHRERLVARPQSRRGISIVKRTGLLTCAIFGC